MHHQQQGDIFMFATAPEAAFATAGTKIAAVFGRAASP
jgi:hypothetical protein